MSLFAKSAVVVPAGPEAAPPTPAPPPPPPSSGMSPTEIAVISSLLSVFGLIASGIAVWKILGIRRKRRASQKVAETEKHDTEAPAPPLHTPVVSPPGVGWTPQIRSISSSSTLVEGSDRIRVTPPMKRTRSPPPTFHSRSSNPFTDPLPKSAPPRTVTFSEKDKLSPFVNPRALTVSSLQTRGLERHAQLKSL